MDAVYEDVCPCADRPLYHDARDGSERPWRVSEPHVLFKGLPGVALAARFCREQLDDGTWSGLPQMARKLDRDHAYQPKDSQDWKVKCECGAVHAVPQRELVFCCGDSRIFLADDEAAYVFELPPQEEDGV